MARYEHLPIYKSALDLCVHFKKLVAGFSRCHKYTLGTELRAGSRAVLTGSVNVIVWKSLRDKQRSVLPHSRPMLVHGEWPRDVESAGAVRHLIARRLEDLTPLLGGLTTRSREFH